MGRVLRTAWYRFTTTLSRRRGGYLTLIVLVGLVGGLAMGSIAGARRTESSFPAYVASTHPSDLEGVTGLYDPGAGSFSAGYNPSLLARIAHLPHVAGVATAVGLNTLVLGPHGHPVSPPALPAQPAEGVGIVGGYGIDQNRVTVTDGRLFDLSRTDEVIMSTATATMFGVHVGDELTVGVYTDAQSYLPGFGTSGVVPHRVVRVRLVGIVVGNNQVVEDDADVASNANLMAFTPALTRQLLGCCVFFSETGIKVAGGASVAPTVDGEITKAVHQGLIQFQVDPSAGIVAKAQRSIEPEAIALGVFGAICGLATLLIGAQIIGRQLRLGVDDLLIERALGADPKTTTVEGLIGVGGSVVVGSVLAALVAIAISPLAPLGPARSVDPTPGISFDWTVLVAGVLALVVILGGVALAVTVRLAPHRAGSRYRQTLERRSAVVGMAAGSGLPESAVTGIRFALEPGVGRNAVPVRSAILGATLAVMVVIATVTFGASLNTLVSSPALYGWNWNYDLTGVDGSSIPQTQVTHLLHADHRVAAWSGVYFLTVEMDGQTVPAISETPNAAVAPPALSGHGVEANDQVVLGQQTLAQLHKRVGDTVVMNDGGGRDRTLRIVGTV
ncbi:MAG TPA: hypothetical protein VHW93_05245, partial [Acidimicrobiales bacterium]|nr:hypothetical protein [Acidimicrobiales bacterium]